MSSRALAASVAAAAVTAAAVATPVLAQSGGGQTIAFKELDKGSHFHYVDNPPRNRSHRRPVFSMGDQFVLSNPLADASGRIGELRAVCTVTHRAKGNNAGFGNSHPFCAGAFVLKGGALFVQVVQSGAKETTGAVVGGTGIYAGARGTFVSTTHKTFNADVVTLAP